MKLTKRFVGTVQPKTADDWYMDGEVRGLGLRVRPGKTGPVRTYTLRYRNRGPQRKVKIGDSTRMSLGEARKEARRLLSLLDLGVDPANDRKAHRQAPTLGELAALYLERHAAPKKKSAARDARTIEVYILPTLGSHSKVMDITPYEAGRLHHSLSSKPVAANRVLALLSAVMTFAERHGMRPAGTNPCRHVERYPERNRERFLSSEELARLGKALQEMEALEHPSAIAALHLLLLTGARKNEILTLQWDQIDLEHSFIRLRDSKTGAKVIPLGEPVKNLLKTLEHREGNPFVCWGDRPRGHLVGLHRAWDRVRRHAGLADVRLHDLRHSYASVGASKGHGLPVLGRLLGHSNPETTARYAHLADHPLRQAADTIASEIAAALGGYLYRKDSIQVSTSSGK